MQLLGILLFSEIIEGLNMAWSIIMYPWKYSLHGVRSHQKTQEILLEITTGHSIDVIDTCDMLGTSKYIQIHQQTMANQGKETFACLLKTVSYIYCYTAVYVYTALCQARYTFYWPTCVPIYC